MTAVICTYPLDVVRARLAFQVTGEHRYTGIANAFHTIYLKVSSSQTHSMVFTNILSNLLENAQIQNDFVCIYFIQSFFFFFLVKEGGVPGFYRGLTPTLIGMAPYAGDCCDCFI